jgi:hypothetical protein
VQPECASLARNPLDHPQQVAALDAIEAIEKRRHPVEHQHRRVRTRTARQTTDPTRG